MRRLTILSVAYPLAPVRDDSPGGAEQVLLQLDRALVAAGHHSIVIAVHGSSSITGDLIETPGLPAPFDDRVRTTAQKNTAAAIEAARHRLPIDLVHLHGIDFYAYLPPSGVPALVTLHLPLAWYPRWALVPQRPQTWLHCVSHAQARAAPAEFPLLPVIENGVDTGASAPARKRNCALYLGRICPEKGLHLAIEAASRAGIPLLIAGAVFPYNEHVRYFEREVAPHLGRACRFLGSLGQKQKRRLLATARCVLIPSLVEETSSLVAREALAAGTAVIAFSRGALQDVVEHGRTGFLVDTAEQMATRIADADTISPVLCRAEARRRFSLAAMTAGYLRLYDSLARQPLRAAG